MANISGGHTQLTAQQNRLQRNTLSQSTTLLSHPSAGPCMALTPTLILKHTDKAPLRDSQTHAILMHLVDIQETSLCYIQLFVDEETIDPSR